MLASATSSSSAGTPLRAPVYQRAGSAPIFKVSTGRVSEQHQQLSGPEQSNLPTIIDLYVPSRARVALVAYAGRTHTKLKKGVGAKLSESSSPSHLGVRGRRVLVGGTGRAALAF